MGILYPNITNIVANGLVVDPSVLLQEKAKLREKGHFQKDSQLLLSDRAQVIMPYHKIIDMGREEFLGKAKIGTTGRGIGPAYEDEASRMGIRIGDLISRRSSENEYYAALDEKNFLIERRFRRPKLNPEEITGISRLRGKVESTYYRHVYRSSEFYRRR